MMRTIKTQKNRGQTLVEFALILPILLVLSMCIIQYGIVMYTVIGLTNLAREGARYAATSPFLTDNEIRQRMYDVRPASIALADINNNNIVITPAQGNAVRAIGTRQLIEVRITYNMQKKMFLPSSFFGVRLFNTNYITSAKMMIE